MPSGNLLSLPSVSLHPAHTTVGQHSNSTLVPLPESFLPEHPSPCRQTALDGLLKKISGKNQPVGEQETGGHQVCLGDTDIHIESDGGGLLKIPLLFSDIVEAGLGDAGYLVAVAPRPPAAKAVDDERPSLKDVWVFVVAGTLLDLKQLFFEMGSRGALRWDLRDCYKVIPKPFGEGGYAQVFLGQPIIVDGEKITKNTPETSCQKMLSTSQVAIKVFGRHKTQNVEDLIRTEMSFLARVRGHPNITNTFGVFCDHQEDPVSWSIVMELFSSGDLFDHLSRHGPLNTKGCAELMEGTFSALQHLHKLRIVHRDVKPENVLMGNEKPILADLGIAANLDENGKVFGVLGSPGYAAPEVVLGKAYNESVDIFSAGCTYYYALTCTQPFQAATRDDTLMLTVQCQVRYPKKAFRQVSSGLVEMIKACISKDPSTRPNASESLKYFPKWRARQQLSCNVNPARHQSDQSLDHQQAEAPTPGPSVTSEASPAAHAKAEAESIPPTFSHGSFRASVPLNHSVRPELTPSPPIGSHRKPPRLPSRFPSEWQPVAERPASPLSAEENQESDAGAVAPELARDQSGGKSERGSSAPPSTCAAAEAEKLASPQASLNAAEEKQERPEKPAMAPEGSRELVITPAAGAGSGAEAGAGAGGGYLGKLRGDDQPTSRGRKPLSVPATMMRRVAGAIKDQFFHSSARHSRSSASAVSPTEFSPISPTMQPEIQGPLACAPAPPQSAPPATRRRLRGLGLRWERRGLVAQGTQ